MLAAVDNRRLRYTAFILLMLTINLVDSVVTKSIADPVRRMTVATAATIDVVLVVSAIYYWLLVRPGIRAKGSLILIAAAGVLHASSFFPGGFRIKAVLGGLGEALLVGFVAVRVRQSRRRGGTEGDADPADAIRTAVASMGTAPRVVSFIAGEMTVLYYALFSWRAQPHVPVETRAFSLHQKSGHADLFGVFPLLCLMEIVPVHLVLGRWSSSAAWIATGLSLYSVLWFAGLARAFRLRPVVFGDDYVRIRYGLLYDLRVPKESILRVRRAEPGDERWAVPRKSSPTLCIEFTGIMEAEGPFGIRRRTERLALAPDDQPAFEKALAELISGASSA